MARPTAVHLKTNKAGRSMSVGLLVGILVFTILVWQAWNSWVDLQDVVENGYQFLEVSAEHRALRMSKALLNVKMVLGDVSERMEKNPRITREELAGFLEAAPEVRSLLVINPEGRVSLATVPGLAGLDVSDREYFHFFCDRTSTSATTHISRPITTKATNIYTITISQAIRDASGRVVAILVAAIDPDLYQTILKETITEGDIEAVLINHEGDIIGYEPAAFRDLIGLNLQGGIAFTAHQDSGQALTRHLNATKLTGEMSASVFLDIPGTQLTIISSRPYNSLLSSWRQGLIPHLVVLLALLVIAGLLALWARRRQAEQDHAYMFATGLIETAGDLIIGLDEEGKVRLFNKMAESLCGYSREEIMGQNLFRFLLTEDEAARLMAIFKKARTDGSTENSGDITFKNRAGKILTIDWHSIKTAENIYGVTSVIFGHDITLQRRQEQTLRQDHEEIQRLSDWRALLLNSAGEGIYGVDLEGHCIFINPTALHILGYEEQDVLGRNTHDLFHHHHADGSAYLAQECPTFKTLAKGLASTTEEPFHRKTGELILVQMRATPIFKEGQCVGAEVIFEDITLRKEKEEELIRLATTDFLTGLPNRRFFLQSLGRELSRQARGNVMPCTVLMFDIDHFKVVNDIHGHACGDLVLKNFASIILRGIRKSDMAGRLGGEEFAVILTDCPFAQAVEMAERLRLAVAGQAQKTSCGEISITTSIGIAVSYVAETDVNDLIGRADTALYEAKRTGRNRICFSPAQKEEQA